MSYPKTIHVVQGGVPLCGFTREMPVDWPPGSVWCRPEEVSTVLEAGLTLCPGCSRALAKVGCGPWAKR